MRPTRCCCPGDDEDMVAEILRYCSDHGIAVVPFGGGTNVIGGLDPTRGAVQRRDLAGPAPLRRAASPSTRCPAHAELGAGVTGPDAERLLGEHGFSLGHFPQSFEFATIGGFAATRSSGQDSAGYGRFNDMILGLRMITPVGVLDLGRVAGVGRRPRPAATADRLRGHLGRHHQGAAAGAPDTGNHTLRGVVVSRFRHRGRRAAGRRPDRHRTHRDPALRRGRDRGQPGHH